MYVVHAQVGHEPEGVFGLSGDLAMPADVEPHLAQFEGDKVLVTGVERQAEHVVVEVEHALQTVGPYSYADNAGDHIFPPVS